MNNWERTILATAFFAVGMSAGIVVVDDHPNAQKLTIATMSAQLQENQKAVNIMVAPCMKFLAEVDSTHITERLPK